VAVLVEHLRRGHRELHVVCGVAHLAARAAAHAFDQRVELLEHRHDPRAADLGERVPQLRVTFEHSAEEKMDERALRVVRDLEQLHQRGAGTLAVVRRTGAAV
jgi:hypothetical protein